MLKRQEMKVTIFIMFVLAMILACGVAPTWEPYPPKGFQESDLIGTWEAKYAPDGSRVDRITLRTDGTYQQIYRNSNGYTYESPWNEWSIETLSDGAVYLHLDGMRFYVDGRKIAEREGLDIFGKPHYFYDRSRDDLIQMLDEGILRVGTDDTSHNIVLITMEYDIEASNQYTFRPVDHVD